MKLEWNFPHENGKKVKKLNHRYIFGSVQKNWEGKCDLFKVPFFVMGVNSFLGSEWKANYEPFLSLTEGGITLVLWAQHRQEKGTLEQKKVQKCLTFFATCKEFRKVPGILRDRKQGGMMLRRGCFFFLEMPRLAGGLFFLWDKYKMRGVFSLFAIHSIHPFDLPKEHQLAVSPPTSFTCRTQLSSNKVGALAVGLEQGILTFTKKLHKGNLIKKSSSREMKSPANIVLMNFLFVPHPTNAFSKVS